MTTRAIWAATSAIETKIVVPSTGKYQSRSARTVGKSTYMFECGK